MQHILSNSVGRGFDFAISSRHSRNVLFTRAIECKRWSRKAIKPCVGDAYMHAPRAFFADLFGNFHAEPSH
jgi:hypothetical protein